MLRGYLATICLVLIIGCRPTSDPKVTEGPLASFPLTRVVPDKESRLRESDLASAESFEFVLAIGSGSDGYNVLRLNRESRITYEFRANDAFVPIAADARADEWRKATFSITQAVAAELRKLLLDVGFCSWDEEYHAAVFDGLQAYLTVQAGPNRKAVYFDNHFPDGLQRLVQFVNAQILVPNEEALIKAERTAFPDHQYSDLMSDRN